MKQPIPVTDAMLAAAGFNDPIRFDPSMRALPVATVKRQLWEERYRAMAATDATREQVAPDQLAVRQALQDAQAALAASQAALTALVQFMTNGGT